MDEEYPCVIFYDKHNGCFSHGDGSWVAFKRRFIPEDAYKDNITSSKFWHDVHQSKTHYGVGKTPDEAFFDLMIQESD